VEKDMFLTRVAVQGIRLGKKRTGLEAMIHRRNFLFRLND